MAEFKFWEKNKVVIGYRMFSVAYKVDRALGKSKDGYGTREGNDSCLS